MTQRGYSAFGVKQTYADAGTQTGSYKFIRGLGQFILAHAHLEHFSH
jgi:cAMP phosphodiesterase